MAKSAKTARRKTPQEAKAESYERDRCDTYGENSKSSRKNVARHRARTNREFRRAAGQRLQVQGSVSEDRAAELDFRMKTLRRDPFKKEPGDKLATVVRNKLERRKKSGA